MDWLNGVSSITISYSDPMDLENKKTCNATAEMELPEMFRSAIATGVDIFCDTSNGISTSKLKLKFNEEDKPIWEPYP